MGGYGGLRDRNATGLRDAPEARALVLEARRRARAAIVVGRPGDRAALPSGMPSCARWPPNTRIDTAAHDVATHTHSGPGGYVPGFWARARGDRGRTQARRCTRAVRCRCQRKSLRQAIADLAHARATSGVARSELTLAPATGVYDDGASERRALPMLVLRSESRGTSDAHRAVQLRRAPDGIVTAGQPPLLRRLPRRDCARCARGRRDWQSPVRARSARRSTEPHEPSRARSWSCRCRRAARTGRREEIGEALAAAVLQ